MDPVPSILGPPVGQALVLRSKNATRCAAEVFRGALGGALNIMVLARPLRSVMDVAEADVGVYTKHDYIVVVELAAISSALLRKSDESIRYFFVSSRSLSISFTAAFRGAPKMKLIRNEIVESEEWLTGVSHEEDAVGCEEAFPYYLRSAPATSAGR